MRLQLLNMLHEPHTGNSLAAPQAGTQITGLFHYTNVGSAHRIPNITRMFAVL